MKKLERIAASLDAVEERLACPVCGGRMHREGISLRCERRHCFDLSSKGYVTLLRGGGSGANAEMYDRRLFEARGAVFAAGFYREVAERVAQLLEPVLLGTGGMVLDAGCGEGYYLRFLAERLEGRCCLAGIDLSAAGIAAAAREGRDIVWSVADLSNLPFRDGCCDGILNILTPARYGEFRRLLRPEGRLIKVIPAEGYLQEIRRRRAGADGYSNEAVLRYAAARMQLEHRERLTRTYPVSPEDWCRFVAMTPLTEHATGAEMAQLEREPDTQITIDLEILVCRPGRPGDAV